MANVEEIPNTNATFRGTDGDECEAFVVAIRDIAFAKGKDSDYDWMLRYATTRLRGKALRWHAKLDLSIQQSWHQFVQALFEEYPLVEDRDGAGIATPVCPAPSSATLPENERHSTTTDELILTGPATRSSSHRPGGEPVPRPRVYDPSLPGHQMGRLQVKYDEGQQPTHYVSAAKRPTMNIGEALVVTFVSSPKPHPIGCLNSGNRKLCVTLRPPDCTELHYLDGTSQRDQPISIPENSFQKISDIWNISPDGTLNATLPTFTLKNMAAYERNYVPSEYYSTNAVYMDISGAAISFPKDNFTPRAADPYSELPIVRARLVFEPL